MSENRFYYFSSENSITSEPDLSKIVDSLKGGGFVWLDFFNPTMEELSELTKPFGIHHLTIEDCMDDEQVPKIENYPDYSFILFNLYTYKEKVLHIDEINFIIGENFVISINRENPGNKPFFRKLEDRMNLDKGDMRKGPDFLLHTIMDFTVDEKFNAIDSIQDEIDEAEESILKNTSNFKPEELMQIRRYLLSLRKSLFHEREILVKICRRDSSFITEKSIFHFRDIYDHLAKFFEVTEIYREMIASLMEIYLSMINNQMSMIANKTNVVVRRLTLITTIFMPLTLIAGIFGMSEWSMMWGSDNWKISYPIFFLLMIFIGVFNYIFLKWLDKKSSSEDPMVFKAEK